MHRFATLFKQMKENTGETIIFTDGASRGNPGPGGWGAIVIFNEKVTELGGSEIRTTNNRMELRAVIAGLNFVNELSQEKIDQVFIYTDSSYVLKGATQWLSGWEAKNWITSTRTEVLNKDLWQDMATVLRAAQTKGIKIIWKLLSGHVGIPGNERADVIATEFADSAASGTVSNSDTKKPPALFSGAFADYPIKNIFDISPDADAKEKRSDSKDRSRAKAYSYVSKVGGTILVHKTWAECEARVKGIKGTGTFFKKSLNAADEKAIIAEFEAK